MLGQGVGIGIDLAFWFWDAVGLFVYSVRIRSTDIELIYPPLCM